MVRLVPEASALNERSYLYSTHVLDPSVAPQIISAAAVLSGVVLTLVANALRERWAHRRQAVRDAEARTEDRLRWLRNERRAVYGRFIKALEEVTRTMRKQELTAADSSVPGLGCVELIRQSSGDGWDALNELRFIAPNEVVDAAQDIMGTTREFCNTTEEAVWARQQAGLEDHWTEDNRALCSSYRVRLLDRRAELVRMMRADLIPRTV
jgi:hypothetical protein